MADALELDVPDEAGFHVIAGTSGEVYVGGDIGGDVDEAPVEVWRPSTCISSAMTSRLGRRAVSESRFDMVKADNQKMTKGRLFT